MADSNNDTKSSDTSNPQDIAQQLARQVSSATGGDTDPSSIQQKVQEAMSQGQEKGVLNTGQLQEQLQDGSLQEKVKEAMDKGQAPGGFLNKLLGGEINNPVSSYGNSIGNSIESTLSPVGKPLGKGLETVGKPVGGIVDPLVGGVMRSGGGFGDAVGVGHGNMNKRNEEVRQQKEELKEPIGGKEQTGENPLGL